ncbi:MAG TPA: T9SS type A sorting domain-containing protein [Flavobacterium sp.]
MKIKLLFLLFLASLPSFAQYTDIPDVNFENKLIALEIDTDGINGKVLTSSIDKITSLNVSYSSINDLTGIQDFLALTNLECHSNELINLDISKNIYLKGLDCSVNRLTSLDISQNTALITLYCEFNQLTNLDTSNNTVLNVLCCRNNLLKNIDVTKNTLLNDLSCDQNQLTNLDISKNIALGDLDCSNNQLKTLDLSQNTALSSLYCEFNQLTYLDLSKNTGLVNLTCFENQLISLDLSKNTILGMVNCSSNQLTYLNLKNQNNIAFITKDFRYNPNLACIQVDDADYSNTNWASAKDATASYSTNCPSLVEYTFIPDSKFEDKLIDLGIDTDGKNGKVLTSRINTIDLLDVSSSSITDLAGIQDFAALTELYCAFNQLTDLDVSVNTALIILDCAGNQLANLDVSKNIALTDLYCNDNQLKNLDISKNPNLTVFNCFSNQLTSVNVKNGINLEVGDFTNNPDLICIQVDDVAYAETNHLVYSKDQTASYSTNCSYVVQNTLIPDSKFEDKLIELSIDTDGKNGYVLTSSINTIESLDVSSSSITDLTGIQDFLALKSLKSENNQLTNLDVSKNIALESLLLDNNQLTNLDVSKNIALAVLDCDYNQLTELNISKNTALTHFACSYNKLTSLDFSQNTLLYALDCSSNQLTNLDFSQNTVLFSAFCNDNKLTNLDFSNSVDLAFLNCDNNQLTTLDVSKSTVLNYLSCFDNQLINLDVSQNTALVTLDCNSNQLKNLDVSHNIILESFSCTANLLTSLNLKNGNNANISSRDFKENPNLSCIEVDNVAYSDTNWATSKDNTANYSENCPAPYVAISNEFEDKLIVLGIDKDGKNGSVLLADITDVKNIDVSNSGITDLSGIEYFADLEILICKGNLLTTIDIPYNTALKYLDCSQNPLTTLDVTKNTQLTELYCDGITTINNKRSNAKTSVVNQLTVLDLSNNLLLTKLDCSNNQLVSLDVSKNTLLTDINCSNNQLTYLNLNNDNNSKLVNVNFKSNASLSCIQVDDVTFSNTNWTAAKDAIATYSKTACTLGIAETTFETISVYPNPTKGDLHIDNSILEKATVYDALGKLVKTTSFANGSNNNSINLAGLPKGIYYIYLESYGSTIVKKIIVE